MRNDYIPTPRIQCDGEGQNKNHARTLTPCRGGFLYAQWVRSVSVGHAFEKYFIAYGLVEVSFLALEVTKCPFNVLSIWIANGVDYDLRG